VLAHQTQRNLFNARGYFREHLQAGDYYSAGQRITGQWFGAGAQRLGLSGNAQEEEFLRLCDNQHPQSGEKLTVRLMKANRRIFEDFVFSPPKSVSIVALVLRDERVVTAQQAAVTEAVNELEQLAGCRVRKGKSADTDRHTGNVAGARFDHQTSRLLDPQLHTHCIVFNATWDETEGRWKALQNYEILRERHYLTEVYRNRLAAELYRLGYDLNHTRSGFEIRGVSPELCERFSKRREQIASISDGIAARKKGANIHEIRERIAHRIRDRKVNEIDPGALASHWGGQISAGEKRALAAVKPTSGESGPAPRAASEALAWSIGHVFERKSVVRERELFTEALIHRRGEIDLSELRRISETQGLLRLSQGEVSTKTVLEKEWEIICWARDGKGSSAPLNPDYKIPENSSLSE
jgi:conjugative relaxase-like TrwC/TraI family protein